MSEGIPEYTPAKRVRHRFQFPASTVAFKSGIQSITLIELFASEESMAMKRCKNDPLEITNMCALQCLIEVNDKPISLGDGSADKFWETAHPSVRLLVTRAYSEVHNPKMAEVEDFIASHATEV